MRNNDFSRMALGANDSDKLDFSGLEILTPREDSWSKVCARLDAEAGSANKSNIISFRAIYSLVPLAASFALVGVSVLMTAFHTMDDQAISMNNMASSEVVSWYDGLGENSNDDSEFFEDSGVFNYLMKE
ncbi:MAG: hypothetical protein HUK19_01990 [Fibrobacter sp.]|nr:hypothetical protein [Fibrobacter sp.]